MCRRIRKPLCLILQKYLRQGKLPDNWKRGNIVPLFKKGNRQDPLNYRLVSLTSTACKKLKKSSTLGEI